ncbi:hypothetical protein ACVW1B_001700 [Bradyrhizobium sp. USDA 4502]
MPTEVGRCAIFTDITCSKMFAASTTSIVLPVTSIMRLRTMRKMKSNTMPSPMPIESAIREGIAPLGMTRS